MVDIGTLIKEERKKQGITIAELAKKAQVTRRAIYYWESGKRGITVDCADRIWIKKRKVKTGVLSRIPLLPPLLKLILDMYKGGKILLSIQASEDINKNLKDIAILWGINKRICFHFLRKTFERQVYNMNSEESELILVKQIELFNHNSNATLSQTKTRRTFEYLRLP